MTDDVRTTRVAIPPDVEKRVVIASRRRCCLCVFLDQEEGTRRGQIAHLNRNPNDSRFENLVWLCLDHHDQYDSRTSQSKGLLVSEVKTYRDKLYSGAGYGQISPSREELDDNAPAAPEGDSIYDRVRSQHQDEFWFLCNPWRYPLWLVANRPELFAYKASNGADGVCLIERINLPDERIVIACIEIAGNCGNSITNCVEELAFQVCDRFEVAADRLVWLEHYDYYEAYDWSWVTFAQIPPAGPFARPHWRPMTKALWRQLQLRPKKRLSQLYSGTYDTKLIKLFDWPTAALP